MCSRTVDTVPDGDELVPLLHTHVSVASHRYSLCPDVAVVRLKILFAVHVAGNCVPLGSDSVLLEKS
jgi:hypothetical protein